MDLRTSNFFGWTIFPRTMVGSYGMAVAHLFDIITDVLLYGSFLMNLVAANILFIFLYFLYLQKMRKIVKILLTPECHAKFLVHQVKSIFEFNQISETPKVDSKAVQRWTCHIVNWKWMSGDYPLRSKNVQTFTYWDIQPLLLVTVSNENGNEHTFRPLHPSIYCLKFHCTAVFCLLSLWHH